MLIKIDDWREEGGGAVYVLCGEIDPHTDQGKLLWTFFQGGLALYTDYGVDCGLRLKQSVGMSHLASTPYSVLSVCMHVCTHVCMDGQ